MRLERDQRRSSLEFGRRANGMADHIDVAEVNPVEAADGQRHGPDRSCGKSQVDLQRSTFSGTNVLRSGSV